MVDFGRLFHMYGSEISFAAIGRNYNSNFFFISFFKMAVTSISYLCIFFLFWFDFDNDLYYYK